MATLDIFATNIIASNNSVTNFSLGENPSRWLKIKSSNFFIVKKLALTDSTLISNILDNVNQGLTIIFDSNGNIGVLDKTTNQLTNTVIMNPLVDNTNTDLPANSTVEMNQKSFVNKSLKGYCANKNIIFSIPGLKWILYRDESKQMYILYNPMHRTNVKNYYNSVSGINQYGNDFMRALISKYSSSLNVTPLSDSNRTPAVYADPTCNCFTSLRNCTNDFAGFYMTETDSNQVGWSCTCGSGGTCSNDYTTEDSFLPDFKAKVQSSGNIKDCSPNITICNAIFTAAGNVEFTNDSSFQQKCGQQPPNPPPNQPPNPPPNQPPPPTEPQTEPPTQPSQSKSSTPIIVGASLGGLALIIIFVIIYMKMK